MLDHQFRKFIAARKISGTMALVFGYCFAAAPAMAASNDDVDARIAALEKENAAIRKENELLRANRQLREQNAALKPQPARAALPSVDIGSAKPDPFAAYASDLPVAYKTAPTETRGQLRVWGEGGAVWSGGDPVMQNFNLVDFTNIGALLGLGLQPQAGTLPGSFDLTPKVGWEGATGFDYRLAGSLWHVSGQFRYGESRSSGLAATSGSLSPFVLSTLFSIPPITSAGGSETMSTTYKEKRWLADLAVGRDIAGSGPDSLQIKGGLRIAELVDTMDTTDAQHHAATIAAPGVVIPTFPPYNAITADSFMTTAQRSSFLGVGPKIGIEGSVPFAGRWAFDYQGDAAVLFGTEKSVTTTSSITTVTPSFLNILNSAPGGILTTTAAQQFATMLNGDIQVGIGYWVTPYLKVTGSYRLDAFIHVANESNTAANNLTPDRYIHGPRLTVTGQF
jgi:hypothetical protein